jgi:hypothetical protein
MQLSWLRVNAQGHGTNCGKPIYSGVRSSVDKQAIVDAHNDLRRQVATGREARGNSVPQPAAANMRQIVSIYIYECITYLLPYLLIYSMEQSPWEANQSLQLENKFPIFLWNPQNFTVLTSARHLSLSWANSIQSPSPLPTSLWSILILSSHLLLGLHNCLLPSRFPTNTVWVFDGIELARHRDRWRALVYAVMNLMVP